MARKSRVKQSLSYEHQENKVYQAAIYTRLSVEDGDDEEQNSIGNQKKIAMHFLANCSDITVVDIYSDNGVSGMTYNRPDFNRMLMDIRTGRINCVIVKDISRLGRHFVMTSEYVERTFPQMDVRLICINDDYDSNSETADASSLLMPIKMVMNDAYAKDISKKIRSSITAKMNQGEYLPSSSSVPYGYVRNQEGTSYDIDDEAAEIVQRIYEMRADGMMFNAIARQLNLEEIPCPGKLRYIRGITLAAKYENALWIRGTIRKITNDRVYLGDRIHGRVKRDNVGMDKRRRGEEEWKIIENAHPAIIQKELFDLVQRVNQAENEKRRTYESRNVIENDMRSIFQGKVFCGECQGTMGAFKGCARPNTKTSSRAFFDCNSYKYSNHARCSSHYIRQEAIVKTVGDLLSQQIKIAVDMERMIRDIECSPAVQLYQKTSEQEHSSIVLKRRALEAKIEHLLVDLTERVIDRNEYDFLKDRYTRSYNDLLEQEAKSAEQMRRTGTVLNSAKKWIGMIRHCEHQSSLTHELVDCLIERIEVYADKRVRVILNYEDPYRMLLDFMKEVEVMKNAV